MRRLDNVLEKENEIIFWCNLKGIPNVVPIRESKYFIPEWFKKAPAFPPKSNELTGTPTVKRCPGFIDFFKMGYVLPAWCDYHLQIMEDTATVKSPDNAFPYISHGPQQFKNYLPKHAKENVKFVFHPKSPWRAKTPKGVKMLMLPLLHHYNPDFYAVSGIIDTSIFQELNPIILFNKIGEFFIKRGTPLSLLIPLRLEEFSVTVREGNEEDNDIFSREYYAINSVFNSRFRKYEKIE